MRKELYLSIVNRLKRIVFDNSGEIFVADTDEQITEKTNVFKHFDLWNHNVEFIEQESVFSMPAVFIEFAPIKWGAPQQGAQAADITINLHIVSSWDNSAADESIGQEQALALFDLLDAVKKALNNHSGSGFRAMKRISSQTNHDHESIIESIESFSVSVTDKA